jgi:hypothetical protein
MWVVRDDPHYPTWVALNPNYKTITPEGASKFRAGAGSADAQRAKRSFVYDVDVSDTTVTWRIVDSTLPFGQGSFLSYEVVPHPTLEGASLVVHRQVGLLPASGRVTKYLTSDDSKGVNRWWKDSTRHAKRTHWAIDAAISSPPGDERKATYLASYQREFRELPFWAEK